VARKSHPARDPANGGLPSKKQILDFLNSAQGKAGKREIARAFGVSGGARIALKRLLAEMAADGTLGGDKKHLREKGKLPPVAVLEVTGRDSDGDLVAKPLEWEADDGGRPVVRLRPAERGIDDSDIGETVAAPPMKQRRSRSCRVKNAAFSEFSASRHAAAA
jgi:ribonuclease R